MSEPDSANPLFPIHEQAEAEFQNYAGVQIVSTFGEPQAEYAAIRKGCALMDLPQRGILEITGKDRLDFLNRFLTNALIDKETAVPLPAGSGIYAYLLNNKGRIVADMNVLERGDRAFLETDLRNIAPLKSTLEKFVFSEKVQFTNQAGTLHEIALHGPKSLEILKKLAPAATELLPLASAEIELTLSPSPGVPEEGKFASRDIVWRDDPTGTPGYFLILPSASARAVWMKFLTEFGADVDGPQPSKRQLWPAGWAAFNTTRIEAGRTLFGIDFDDTFLPAESGQLERAVSFTKGCYLGQEIVARMHARGQVAKKIVGIRMQADALPIAGEAIFDAQQNPVGGITSSTLSPILSGAAICLGIVKSSHSAIGAEVLVAAEGAMRKATVVPVPFVKPQEVKSP